MAPIRYVPQVIPTDLGQGLLQEQDRRQGQYDAAFSGMNQAEDQFGQFQVDASDIAGKNYILGQFKDKTKAIVDKHGGDYGAAAKELAREVTKTRSNQFFQLAPQKQKLAEEERRRLQQLGPNAIIRSSVLNKQTFNPETGEYIRPEELTSDIRNRQDYVQMLDKDFAEIRNKVTEGEWGKSKLPGKFERNVTKGISPAEQQQLAERMFTTIKERDPELSDEDAMDIANNQAATYVGGVRTEQQNDPNYMTDLERQQRQESLRGSKMQNDVLKMQLDKLKNPVVPQGGTGLPFTPKRQPVASNPTATVVAKQTGELSKLSAPSKVFTQMNIANPKDFFAKELAPINTSKNANPVNKESILSAVADANAGTDKVGYNAGQRILKAYYLNNPDGVVVKKPNGTYFANISTTQAERSLDKIRQTEKFANDVLGIINYKDDQLKKIKETRNPLVNGLIDSGIGVDSVLNAVNNYAKHWEEVSTITQHLDDSVYNNSIKTALSMPSNSRLVDVQYKDKKGNTRTQQYNLASLARTADANTIEINPATGMISMMVKPSSKDDAFAVDIEPKYLNEGQREVMESSSLIYDKIFNLKTKSSFIPIKYKHFGADGGESGYFVEKVLDRTTGQIVPKIFEASKREDGQLYRTDMKEVDLSSVNNDILTDFYTATVNNVKSTPTTIKP